MRIVVYLVLVFITTSVNAGWMNMEDTNNEVHYMDTDTIVSDGVLRKVWQLTDRKKAGSDGVMSLRVLLEFDCSAETYRLLEIFAYSKPMATGVVVHSLLFGSQSEWSGVPERTVTDRIALISCAI